MTAPQHFSEYCSAVASRVARVDAAPRRTGAFSYRVSGHKVGSLEFVEIRSDPVAIRRSPDCISADPRTHYIIALHTDGACRLRQCESDILVPAQSFVFIDKAIPYEADFINPTHRLLVCVPRLQLEQRLRDPERYLRKIVPADRGMGSIAARYMLSLYEEADRLDPVSLQNAADVCVDVLTMALSTSIDPEGWDTESALPGRTKALVLLSRIKAHIRGRIDDPALSPAAIAEAHAISKRYLHRLFNLTGTSVGAWIREERLRLAYGDLTNPRARYMPITEVALRHGFSDSAHFSRAFRKRFGKSPTMAKNEARPLD